MSVLAEFLKEQGAKIRETAPARQAERNEWLTAIHELLTTLGEWVTAVEGRDVLSVSRLGVTITEVRLGRYETHRLRIELAGTGAFVEFVPVQRFAVGSVRPEGVIEHVPITGLVSVSESGRPYQNLYRIGTGEAGRWYVSAGGWDGEGRHVPLTRERFESLLVYGLQ